MMLEIKSRLIGFHLETMIRKRFLNDSPEAIEGFFKQQSDFSTIFPFFQVKDLFFPFLHGIDWFFWSFSEAKAWRFSYFSVFRYVLSEKTKISTKKLDFSALFTLKAGHCVPFSSGKRDFSRNFLVYFCWNRDFLRFLRKNLDFSLIFQHSVKIFSIFFIFLVLFLLPQLTHIAQCAHINFDGRFWSEMIGFHDIIQALHVIHSSAIGSGSAALP